MNYFAPTYDVVSAYHIPYEQLFQNGIRGIIFDIDNTLVRHGADADAAATALLNHLKRIGFQICLLSNNGEERVKRFNKTVRVQYIFKAHKPAKAGYQKAMEQMGTNTANTIFVGDQIFTDLWGANRLHIETWLVLPIHPKEEIQIVLKRFLERPFLAAYRQNHKKDNIVLTGFMASGKTTLGSILAQQKNMFFVDTDALIEKQEGMSVSDIFAQKGEAYFRKLERVWIKRLSKLSGNMVIATGGGLPIQKGIEKRLKALGTIWYLDVPFETIHKRLILSENRPLALADASGNRTMELYEKRKPIYAMLADKVLQEKDILDITKGVNQ